MNYLLTYLLAKESFWDSLSKEFREIGEAIKDFFLMIKEYTFDIAAGKFGTELTSVVLIGIVVVLIMFILLKIINR